MNAAAAVVARTSGGCSGRPHSATGATAAATTRAPRHEATTLVASAERMAQIGQHDRCKGVSGVVHVLLQLTRLLVRARVWL